MSPWVVSRVSGADTGAKKTGPSRLVGRVAQPSQPTTRGAARARGQPRKRSQRRGERDAEVPALNQLISQGSANVGELTPKPGDVPDSGVCQPRTQAPPARSTPSSPPPRAMMRIAVFFMMSPHVFLVSIAVISD